MVAQITLTGMVLSAAPVGDYDKRLVILTRERGKITAFAKGARRPNSQYVAGSRPFSFGEFILYQGREAYTLTGMNITNYFEDMALNLDKVYYGMYFLELAGYFGREGVEAKDMLNLLYASFTAINKDKIPHKLIKCIFELKIFALNGEYPDVFCCQGCGRSEELTYFSISADGVLCHSCKDIKKDGILLNSSTLYTLQYIISSPIGRLYTFKVSDEVMTELSMVMSRWIAVHCDREFKSLELLG